MCCGDVKMIEWRRIHIYENQFALYIASVSELHFVPDRHRGHRMVPLFMHDASNYDSLGE